MTFRVYSISKETYCPQSIQVFIANGLLGHHNFFFYLISTGLFKMNVTWSKKEDSLIQWYVKKWFSIFHSLVVRYECNAFHFILRQNSPKVQILLNMSWFRGIHPQDFVKMLWYRMFTRNLLDSSKCYFKTMSLK